MNDEEFFLGLFLMCVFLNIVFVILKVTGSITWSWVWVLCPLWVFTILTAIILIINIIAWFRLKDL